jgi:hypothetical protein
MTMPTGHMPWHMVHTQVSGTSHHGTRPVSRARSQAAVVTTTRR